MHDEKPLRHDEPLRDKIVQRCPFTRVIIFFVMILTADSPPVVMGGESELSVHGQRHVMTGYILINLMKNSSGACATID